MHIIQCVVRRDQRSLQLLGGELCPNIQQRPEHLQKENPSHRSATGRSSSQNPKGRIFRQFSHSLTCKKLSSEAICHIDRIPHLGSCDGDEGCGAASGVTILLFCCFSSLSFRVIRRSGTGGGGGGWSLAAADLEVQALGNRAAREEERGGDFEGW